MSADPLHFEGELLRRTQSTGDIPIPEIPRPARARITPNFRRSEGHSNTVQPAVLRERVDQERSSLYPPDPIQLPSQQPALVPAPVPILPELPERGGSTPTPIRVLPSPPRQQQRRSGFYASSAAYFGYGPNGTKERREAVSLIWNLSWTLLQSVLIITFVSLAAQLESRTSPGMNEWQACGRPLGIWNCLWLGRGLFTCSLSYWSWSRYRKSRTSGDVESSHSSDQSQPISPPVPENAGSSHMHANSDNNQESSSPHSRLQSRLTLISSLMTLTWFLTAQILAYTSISTCRHSSPHLWWLTFGILCIVYLMVLEVFLVGLIIFIVVPILFIFYNIILICMGRHPLQNPTMIKPEIGKLPKAVVDAIPLVVYIPPPPDEPPKAVSTPVITCPKPVHSYPPQLVTANPPKRRFVFFRKISRKKTDQTGLQNPQVQEEEKATKNPESWEDHWEQGDYPFVRLEGNRASCAICLMDFEEPRKVIAITPVRTSEDKTSGDDDADAVPVVKVEEIPVNSLPDEMNTRLKLADVGEGAQPLRLLNCGHVFHKTCLDPWLTDVSGRCPVCQRPVERPAGTKKERSRRNH